MGSAAAALDYNGAMCVALSHCRMAFCPEA